MYNSLLKNRHDAILSHTTQKNESKRNSAAGNWARVFRVTGGDSNHYTTAEVIVILREDLLLGRLYMHRGDAALSKKLGPRKFRHRDSNPGRSGEGRVS